MGIIKRHKGLAIVGSLTLILIIILFAIFSRMIFSTGKTEYGDRLKNIVEISDARIKELKGKINEKEGVEDVTLRTQGKIIYITITFSESTGKDSAKNIANETLSLFSEEELKCYDVAYFLTQKEKLDDEGNNTAYVVAGTKHPEKENISWTRN